MSAENRTKENQLNSHRRRFKSKKRPSMKDEGSVWEVRGCKASGVCGRCLSTSEQRQLQGAARARSGGTRARAAAAAPRAATAASSKQEIHRRSARLRNTKYKSAPAAEKKVSTKGKGRRHIFKLKNYALFLKGKKKKKGINITCHVCANTVDLPFLHCFLSPSRLLNLYPL
uniref:Uncharacterized protein n=1 Tax=Apteryx owenii TaxID=8824 RepID=A0A8B9PZZ8_APTOW